MAITLDNSTDTVDFGDAALKRKGTNALETPGALDVAALKVTGTGITFPDNTTMNTAPSGGGSSGLTNIYNNTARYNMVNTTGQNVWCVSTSTVFGNKSWTRSTTTLTVTHVAHGRSVGDRVIVRNSNVDYQVALIVAITTDTWTINCADVGGTSGAASAYLLGFTYAHNSSTPGSLANGTVTAPAGADCQLLSLRVNLGANQRAATNYIIIVPNSALNGAGENTNLDNIYVPVVSVRQTASGLLTAVGATLTTFGGSNYASFQVASLSTVVTANNIAMQF